MQSQTRRAVARTRACSVVSSLVAVALVSGCAADPTAVNPIEASPAAALVTTHAPAGYNALSALSCSVVAEPGWKVQLTGGSFRSVVDPTSPDVTTGACELTYPQGFVDGRAPATYWTPLPGVSNLYVRYWSKLSTNFVGHPVGFKQMIAKTKAGWQLFPRLVGTGLTAGFTAEGSTINTALPAGKVTVSRGVWHLNEMLLTGSGHVTYWLDGQVIVNASVAGFTPSVWTELQWRPIEGGNMGWKTPAAQTETIDGVVVTGY